MGAGAGGCGDAPGGEVRRAARQGVDCIEDGVNLRADDAVEDIPPIAAVLDDARLAQHRQLLGEVRLAVAEGGFHVADAFLAAAQRGEDRQPAGMGEQLEDLRLGGEGSGGFGNHIHKFEYDYTSVGRGVKGGNAPRWWEVSFVKERLPWRDPCPARAIFYCPNVLGGRTPHNLPIVF